MYTLSIREARRLALCRAGLLKPAWAGFPQRAAGAGKVARKAALEVVRRFGYLQLDTVSVAGARSHVLVLLSRLDGLDPELGEDLLKPGEPLFEYWGHEACWLPLELYPTFAFRRAEFHHHHPWWGDLLHQHRREADALLCRIREEGPLRSLDLEGPGSRGWWDLKLTKRLATAFWSRGELAIRERKNFQRTFDLSERVIPEAQRSAAVPQAEAIKTLLLQALAGHGWAQTGTLAQTWRLRNRPEELRRALAELCEEGTIRPCTVEQPGAKALAGWVRTADLELAAALARVRPDPARGVLLSPFDPLLWDRKRVAQLFGFEQVLEIFKRAEDRQFGYYCLPVLAGERLVARVDLKAERAKGILRVVATHYESEGDASHAGSDREATRLAVTRYAAALGLETSP